MTDYRDPKFRDSNDPRLDPKLSADEQPWSNATWGWIAGVSVAVLILVLVAGSSREPVRTATGPTTMNPPATSPMSPPTALPPTASPEASPPAPAPAR